jgi:serine/threonine-protein kinase RsbW
MASTPGHGPIRHSFDITSDPAQIERVEAALLQSLELLAYPKAAHFALRLALHEAITNAFRHGHRELPPSTPVHVDVIALPDSITMQVRDQGPGFDPGAVPDPTTDENLERGSGRGLLLIRAYMSRAEYLEGGRMLRMVYQRPPGA